MKVKICGITSLSDAIAAVQAGADLLGFNFYPPSPRYLSPQACAGILASLRSQGCPVLTIGVFVNEPVDSIRTILDQCGLHLAQLSGDEPPEHLLRLDGRAFKGLRPRHPEIARSDAERYAHRSAAPVLLLDAYRPGQYGGTGQAADWSIARNLAGRYPALLAGGLTPENVAQAVARVRPWGVDVASGVESAPGRKDPARMAAFVRAARQIQEEVLS